MPKQLNPGVSSPADCCLSTAARMTPAITQQVPRIDNRFRTRSKAEKQTVDDAGPTFLEVRRVGHVAEVDGVDSGVELLQHGAALLVFSCGFRRQLRRRIGG